MAAASRSATNATAPQRLSHPEIDGTDLAVRFKGARQPVDFQMRIMFDVAHHQLRADGVRDFRHGSLLDGRLSADEVAATAILVNLFDGGPRSEVSYRINGGEYMPLERVLRRDPHIVEQYNRHRDTKKSWVEATMSTHIFEADLDDSIPEGTHTVTVRAVDEFGRVHHGHTVLEIVGVHGERRRVSTTPSRSLAALCGRSIRDRRTRRG